MLAAVATGWALGISNDLIRAGIVTFDVGQVDVPGRFTLFERNGATVVVDDAHNAPALEALAAALDRFPAERRMIVYGAGAQRRDEDMVRQGKVLGATFDRVFLCEDRSVKRALPDARHVPCSSRGCTKDAASPRSSTKARARTLLKPRSANWWPGTCWSCSATKAPPAPRSTACTSGWASPRAAPDARRRTDTRIYGSLSHPGPARPEPVVPPHCHRGDRGLLRAV